MAVATTVQTQTDLAFQRCIMPGCGATYDIGEVRTSCDACGALLDVAYDWDALPVPHSLKAFEAKWSRRNEPLCHSGVWRFYELLPFAPPAKSCRSAKARRSCIRQTAWLITSV